jgi:hypothetical protein
VQGPSPPPVSPPPRICGLRIPSADSPGHGEAAEPLPPMATRLPRAAERTVPGLGSGTRKNAPGADADGLSRLRTLAERLAGASQMRPRILGRGMVLCRTLSASAASFRARCPIKARAIDVHGTGGRTQGGSSSMHLSSRLRSSCLIHGKVSGHLGPDRISPGPGRPVDSFPVSIRPPSLPGAPPTAP